MFGRVFSILCFSLGCFGDWRWAAVCCLIVFRWWAPNLGAFPVDHPYLRMLSKQKLRLGKPYGNATFCWSRSASIRDIKLTGIRRLFSAKGSSKTGEESQGICPVGILAAGGSRFLNLNPLGHDPYFAVGACSALRLNGNRLQAYRDSSPSLLAGIAPLRLTPPLQEFFSSLISLRGGLPRCRQRT